ncbi:Alpha-xylosidase 1 [Forsythia ovata]|uniref:Alpha-xylosidase 1 n=1 Tax=Forsythia ovata TaxID=205694 RepID=A0ABD1XAL8_9LAMI
MTPFSLVIAFPIGATEGEAKGNLFVDDDELPEMKLGNGYSTYVDFYATVSKGMVKGDFEVEVDGKPIANTSKLEFSTAEHKYTQKLKDSDQDKIKSVMTEVKGLELPVGKKFAISWKMGIKA